jgi:hypothetical protein
VHLDGDDDRIEAGWWLPASTAATGTSTFVSG